MDYPTLVATLREDVRILAEKLRNSEGMYRQAEAEARSARADAAMGTDTISTLQTEVLALRRQIRESLDEESTLRSRLLESETVVLRLREELQRTQARKFENGREPEQQVADLHTVGSLL
jgi:septal ring factor EnvC (AmiA/AmiB activator)